MNWLKNLFKNVEPAQQTKKIRFDEIETVLSEKTNEIKPGLESKVKQFRKDFIYYFESLVEDFDGLDSAKFEPVILEDKRDISNIVDTSRKNYSSSSKKVLSNAIAILKIKDSPAEMSSAIIDVFNKLNNLSRDAQILLSCFQSEMKNISLALKRIKEEGDNLESFLDKDYFVLNLDKRAGEQVELIKSRREREKRKIIEKKEIAEKIKKLEKETEAKESEMRKIKESEEALKLFNLEKEKILLKSRLNGIISEMDNMVNNISRQIKKYLHSEKVSKQDKSQIENLLDKPKNLFKEDCAVFEKILKETKKKIKDVETDEKKRKKFLLAEKNIKASLRKIISEHNKVLKKIEENLGKIRESDVKENIKEIEIKIERINNHIRQLKEDREKIEKEAEYNEEEELKKLESLLSKIFDKEVKIK